jgi:hypothetical protein
MTNIYLTASFFSLPKNFDYLTDDKGGFFGVFTGEEKFNFALPFMMNLLSGFRS